MAGFKQPKFIEPVRLTDEALEPVAVHSPLKSALTHADKYQRRRGGGSLGFYPNQAQGVNAKRGTRLPKKLVDELFATQVFPFRKSEFFSS